MRRVRIPPGLSKTISPSGTRLELPHPAEMLSLEPVQFADRSKTFGQDWRVHPGRGPESGPRVGCSRLTRRHVRRYLTFVKTTVSSKGQIVLPAEFRRMDRVEPGQEFDVERLDRGDYRLVRRAAPPHEGAIDWLLACPRKGFYVPIDSESTDAL